LLPPAVDALRLSTLLVSSTRFAAVGRMLR